MIRHPGIVESAMVPIEVGTEAIAEPWHAKWSWYEKGMGKAERRLLLKLDLMILTFGSMTFFTKVCQSNSHDIGHL